MFTLETFCILFFINTIQAEVAVLEQYIHHNHFELGVIPIKCLVYINTTLMQFFKEHLGNKRIIYPNSAIHFARYISFVLLFFFHSFRQSIQHIFLIMCSTVCNFYFALYINSNLYFVLIKSVHRLMEEMRIYKILKIESYSSCRKII